MAGPLDTLGLSNPVLAAPMAGGPTTPDLVVAAARAGSLGFLAGGYKSAEQLAEQLGLVRAETEVFGVNLFVPNPVPVDPSAYRAYAQSIQPEADLYDLDLSHASLTEDDDAWGDKLDLLRRHPVPVVSFTFGLPDAAVIGELRRAGTMVMQTVTSPDEARLAAAAGVDMLAVQGVQAGGHYGSFTPSRRSEQLPLTELVRAVRAAVPVPLVAAGGLASPEEVAAVLGVGAEAVVVGTVLLRTEECGASAPYRTALAGGTGDTIVTRAFSGRPARALPNLFTERYDALAPSGYPAIHHLTSPLRRAAAAAGDADRINIWAGTGYRAASEGSAVDVLHRLAERV